mmetsp:Transcript_11295/g.42313  ORF Transcript_11295/g.42313 Transcript_11295/m.42313 type:complete len:303 (-) Transcript_11295:206-1114(-)|eukprot:CAMPEP_0117447014 /NCGR_PEP_ID=MMETSP0759-20121206/6648_1 /TAXON_ID=63605 /ORGANISM="Percolomonas cosmopolitus, Strain WS" /LENGTH=302 /DNA_ID=CAMNT_0005239319 /DNA_START=92 /DNA_END=1000 /DNA_ORIENTATION=+
MTTKTETLPCAVSGSTDLRILRETFALFDKNNSKRISVRDMGDFLRLLGEDVSEDEIGDMLREVSGNEKASLNFEQFVKFMMSEEAQEREQEAKEHSSTKRESTSSTISSKRSSGSSTASSSRPGTAGSTRKTSTSIKKKKLIPKLKIGSTNQSVSQRKRSKSSAPQEHKSTSSKIFNFLSPRTKKEKTNSARGTAAGSKSSRSTDSSKPKARKRANSSNNANDPLVGERTVQDMRRAFQVFDLDNDGKLSTREVGIMMRRFGLGSGEKSIQNLFDLLDNGEGKNVTEIDFDQFLKLSSLVE